MRRISAIWFALFLVTLLAACGGGDGEQAPATSAATTGSQAATSTTSGTPAGQAAKTPPTTPVAAATAMPTEAATQTATSGDATTPAATTASNPGPTASGDFGYGFNVFYRGDADGAEFNHQTLNMVQGAGFNWVRIQIEWSAIELSKNSWDPLGLDRLVEQYQGSNVKILGSVVDAPEWARDPSGQQFLKDYADWEGFMHFLAERYKGKIHAWEIWNEQNLAPNMGGQVRLEDYCRLLEGGYRGVKLADPDATVVFGGLTPTGVSDPSIAVDDLVYLQNFYLYKDGYYTKFFDALGMHVSATNNAPDLMYPANPGTGAWSQDPSFYFRRAEQLHNVMVENGDNRPVWITEFGWTTANQAAGYEYGADNSEQDQADYLTRAFEIARNDWPWVKAMFVWNLNFSVVSPPSDEKFPWSVLNADWSPRPAYTALKEMPKS